MKVTRVLHHSLNVEGSLETSVAFYRRLGLESAERPDIPGIDGHWFGVGQVQLHLVDAPAGEAGIRPAGPHVCFAVDDLSAWVRELEARSVPFDRAFQGDVEQIWIVDPAGNTVELQQDRDLR
ncbi:MAG: VOC family protein [Acidimicrobiales bacterium]